MGSGESRYVEDQERFVNANIGNFKKVLPEHYSKSQVKGKLRQLYANSDCSGDNTNSYILDNVWRHAKSKISPIYQNTEEQRGARRYN